VLRVRAIGARLHEDITLLKEIDLKVPPSSRLARGIEFAARFALEKGQDCAGWQNLLDALSRPGAHDAWRHQALMAIVRSERAEELLNRCSATLLARGGALLVELSTAISAVETVSMAALIAKAVAKGVEIPLTPGTLRTSSTPSAPWLVMWCLDHAAEIPVQAIAAVVKLVEIQIFLLISRTDYGRAAAKMLFGWLLQLDLRTTRSRSRPRPMLPGLRGRAAKG